MNTVYCKICNNTFLSDRLKGNIQPWNCPKCNKDNDENIQRDVNELFKIDGLLAIDNIISRLERLDNISKMMWKKKESRKEDVMLY